MLPEAEEERTALERYLAAVGAKPDQLKNAGAWMAEKLARLKPNGELLRRSPLSDLVELETLRIALEGKAAAFRVLRALADEEPQFDAAELDSLLTQIAQQIEDLEALRLTTAQRVLHHP
jgi:hypothetical protein